MKYRFDRFAFDTDGACLLDGEEQVALEPQVFSLLHYLLENHCRIVTKDELNEHIWDGRIVSDSALSTRIRAVRRALGDDHSQQKFVRTYPKRGFQFVHAVEVVESVGEAADDQVAPSSDNLPRWWRAAALAVFVLAAGLLGWLVYESGGKQAALPLPQKPSIAVLRFANLGGGADDRYFVDGLTEDIITNLSLYRELFVSSRNSTFAYDASSADLAQLAAELGVAFIARGSVRRRQGRIRINIELIEAGTGSTVWAERFERDLTDIFAVQDEISQSIAGRLAPEIVQARVDRARSTPTEDLDAWDLYLRAKAAQSVFTKEDQQEAVRLAKLSIDRDRAFAAPYSLIARARGVQFFFHWSEDPQASLQDAIKFAQSAILLDPKDPVAYAALGYVYRFTGDATQAIANLERAAKLNPNDANIRLELAHTLDWFRKQDRALPEIIQAIRLSPRDPLLQNMFFYKAHILFHLRDFEASLEAAREMGGALTSDTWRLMYQLMRAASLAELGRIGEAGEAVEAALKINPKLSLTAMKKQFEGSKNHPENRRNWLASLRKAGVPE